MLHLLPCFACQTRLLYTIIWNDDIVVDSSFFLWISLKIWWWLAWPFIPLVYCWKQYPYKWTLQYMTPRLTTTNQEHTKFLVKCHWPRPREILCTCLSRSNATRLEVKIVKYLHWSRNIVGMLHWMLPKQALFSALSKGTLEDKESGSRIFGNPALNATTPTTPGKLKLLTMPICLQHGSCTVAISCPCTAVDRLRNHLLSCRSTSLIGIVSNFEVPGDVVDITPFAARV